jgi:4-amino-4-deoxy-L-arabinose transferase-like glycosyltransferase
LSKKEKKRKCFFAVYLIFSRPGQKGMNELWDAILLFFVLLLLLLLSRPNNFRDPQKRKKRTYTYIMFFCI